MGILDKFERGIERTVNGAFAKAFRSEVQPVEIASALRREVDDRAAIVARGRTLVPNAFTVALAPADHERIEDWQDALADELVAMVGEHAESQRYAFVGPISVAFDLDESLDTGVFTVRSAKTKGRLSPAPTGASPTVGRPVLDVDGRTYALSGPVTVIGRGEDADIVLDDPGVSRRHAEVRLHGQDVRVADLGSTNGTFLDGERTQSGRLSDGSVITIGRSRLTFHSSSTADTSHHGQPPAGGSA